MSWVGPSTGQAKASASEAKVDDESNVYRAMVVDSGPIIRQTGTSSLHGKAKSYYTVPAVMKEIRDAKARQHLDQLPFTLEEKIPSAEGVHAITDFARQTGDYQSLSSVDVQVLALLWDLEREGCSGDMSHVRTTPKRKVGIGKIESLGKDEQELVEDGESKEAESKTADAESMPDPTAIPSSGTSFFESQQNAESASAPTPAAAIPVPSAATRTPAKPKSWAALVNPTAASASLPSQQQRQPTTVPSATPSGVEDMSVPFGKMKLLSGNDDRKKVRGDGQFSDAEDDDDELDLSPPSGKTVEEELALAFPSLTAASTVPYEGSDDEADDIHSNNNDDSKAANEPAKPKPSVITEEEWEERKKMSLQPVSKSGKTYNSFRKYGKLMKPKAPKAPKIDETTENIEEEDDSTEKEDTIETKTVKEVTSVQSRIIGGMAFGGQEDEVDDDGEGWVTSSRDIESMKASGVLDPTRKPGDKGSASKGPEGPPISMRTACTTTDFAMQNVILQMNLELLSVDGIKIRRLKSWVTRCGACFQIHTDGTADGPNGMKRLFCVRCGSDMMQRISASVESKTGRLRLHMKKNYQHNLRGTKFSLPKAGSGNKYQGDLLLREDQLLSGAWNKKVRMSGSKSKKAAQSMFGADLATSVGCSQGMAGDDIRVGFGRRNPNAAKGRERRGKKKKSSDKACGLRRY